MLSPERVMIQIKWPGFNLRRNSEKTTCCISWTSTGRPHLETGVIPVRITNGRTRPRISSGKNQAMPHGAAIIPWSASVVTRKAVLPKFESIAPRARTRQNSSVVKSQQPPMLQDGRQGERKVEEPARINFAEKPKLLVH